MALVDWYVEGIQFGNCNCSFGCPCQFEGLPTLGHCRGFEVMEITKGHFGEVQLAGVRSAVLYAWPGPIFEGKGELQAIIDERATPAQREALEQVLHGKETEEAKTHWWVYAAMSDRIHPTLFKPIDYEVDLERRTARVSIPGVLEAVGSPITSRATGEEHRVRIDLPGGIEFELAEIGIASSKANAAITLDLKDSYGQWNILRHSGSGVVRAAPAR